MNTRKTITRASFPTAEIVAGALHGTRQADGWLCHCPVIGHGRMRGDLHPSLSVRDGDTCLLVYCHAGCNSLDVLDALRSRGLEGQPSPPPPRRVSAIVDSIHQPDQRALTIWQVAGAPAGTPVETYLRRRGIIGPISQAIRHSPIVIGHREYPRMIVAAHRCDGELVAAQLTRLTDDGLKAAIPVPRRTIGKLRDGAAHLADAGEVLGLAEGAETALAAKQLSGIPCWASFGAGRMHRVTIPDCVRELHIFGDNDDAGVGAAERTAERHVNDGRRVVLRYPPGEYNDWGSVVDANDSNTRACT
jgi:putative DNA primase/helicase